MARTTLTRALVLLGVVLLVAPALLPVQPVLYHDTRRGTVDDRADLEAQGYEVVAYENLSARGQELYVTTLRAGGEYYVPLGAGADEFPYPSPSELRDVGDYRERSTLGRIVVKRPTDGELPPADEPLRAAEHFEERGDDRGRKRTTPGDGERATQRDRERGTADDRSVEERRQQIARYDVVETRTDLPPLEAPAPLMRLLSVVGGVLALGIGGYLGAQP